MQQTSTKRLQEYTEMGGISDLLGIVQESIIWPYDQIVCA